MQRRSQTSRISSHFDLAQVKFAKPESSMFKKILIVSRD